MLLIEFTAVWRNNWTREEQKQFKEQLLEDELDWPEKLEEDPVVIDMHELDSFNRSGVRGLTRVITKTGSGYLIKMPYPRFRILVNLISTIQTADSFLSSFGHNESTPDKK